MTHLNNRDLTKCSKEEIEQYVRSFVTKGDMAKAAEAAAALGISVHTIRQWDRTGVLKGLQYRYGGAIRWPVGQLAQFLYDRMNTGKRETN